MGHIAVLDRCRARDMKQITDRENNMWRKTKGNCRKDVLCDEKIDSWDTISTGRNEEIAARGLRAQGVVLVAGDGLGEKEAYWLVRREC